MPSKTLKVLTLNCWGVPISFVSKKRHERMVAIGEHVGKSDFEIAVFQEVWKKSDYRTVKEGIGKTLPYSHYFYSGTIGSGLCFFSKYPILETVFHQFTLNGYLHKLQHGDFFGGKGIGMAKIDVDGFIVHLYMTHIHAEYNRDDDEYQAHRACQAFSMAQFIGYTSKQADLALVCGDFNYEPVDLGYKMIRTYTGLRDCWLDKLSTNSSSDPEGNTCDCPSNSFVKPSAKLKCPNGKRIDYILYQPGKDVWVDISECSLTMGPIPGKTFSFSDHEGVTANVAIERKPGAVSRKSEEELSPLLQQTLTMIDTALVKTRSDHKFFLLFSAICLVLAYVVSVIHIPYPLDFFVTFFEVLLILLMGFGVSHTLFMIRGEVHALEGIRDSIKLLLQHGK